MNKKYNLINLHNLVHFRLPFSAGVFHDDAVNQISELAEVLTEGVVSRRVAETSDEQFTKLFRLSPILPSTKHYSTDLAACKICPYLAAIIS